MNGWKVFPKLMENISKHLFGFSEFSKKLRFFQIFVVKMNITVMVTMVAFQLVGYVMANQIACWVMMNKDVQLSCNHLQTDLKFILIRRPIRIKHMLKQLLCRKKLLQIALWLVFRTPVARFNIFMARSYILFGYKWGIFCWTQSHFWLQNLTASSEETSSSPAETITSLPGQADSPEVLITTSFDGLLMEAEMIQITTQPTFNKDHKNHPKNIIYSVETIFIENHSKFLNFNFFLISILFILLAWAHYVTGCM